MYVIPKLVVASNSLEDVLDEWHSLQDHEKEAAVRGAMLDLNAGIGQLAVKVQNGELEHKPAEAAR